MFEAIKSRGSSPSRPQRHQEELARATRADRERRGLQGRLFGVRQEPVGRLTLRYASQNQGDVTRDNGQELIEIMGHAAHRPAERLHFLALVSRKQQSVSTISWTKGDVLAQRGVRRATFANRAVQVANMQKCTASTNL